MGRREALTRSHDGHINPGLRASGIAMKFMHQCSEHARLIAVGHAAVAGATAQQLLRPIDLDRRSCPHNDAHATFTERFEM